MEEFMTSEELKTILSQRPHGTIDVGDKPEIFRTAVKDLREQGVPILIGVRFKNSQGKVEQLIGYGQKQSEKAVVDF